MIKLSQAGKMPCKSFSLQAIKTCPGRVDSAGKVKDICKGCYATKGMYTFPVVKAARENNYEESRQGNFVDEMAALIKAQNNRYFRWFDSGDIYSQEFLAKVLKVCVLTPNVKHWIPTKSRELFDQRIWEELEALPNVRVRFSSDSIVGNFEPEHGSTVIINAGHFPNAKPNEIFICPSGKQGGKCQSCRACWSQKINVVAYIYH